jgi:hypothetical protein
VPDSHETRHALPMALPEVLRGSNILPSIRIDQTTQKGSVYDVVMAVTGCAQSNAAQVFLRLTEQYPAFEPRGLKVAKTRINGTGKETPVADAATLIEIAFLLPGKKARAFGRACADKVRRDLGGDLTLIDEIEHRHSEICKTAQEGFLLGKNADQVAVEHDPKELYLI